MSYPRIVLFREKHGDRHYIANNADELVKVLHYIYLQRKTEGWYADENTRDLSNSPEQIARFMYSRCGYEYEEFEVVQPDEIK